MRSAVKDLRDKLETAGLYYSVLTKYYNEVYYGTPENEKKRISEILNSLGINNSKALANLLANWDIDEYRLDVNKE